MEEQNNKKEGRQHRKKIKMTPVTPDKIKKFLTENMRNIIDCILKVSTAVHINELVCGFKQQTQSLLEFFDECNRDVPGEQSAAEIVWAMSKRTSNCVLFTVVMQRVNITGNIPVHRNSIRWTNCASTQTQASNKTHTRINSPSLKASNTEGEFDIGFD